MLVSQMTTILKNLPHCSLTKIRRADGSDDGSGNA